MLLAVDNSNLSRTGLNYSDYGTVLTCQDEPPVVISASGATFTFALTSAHTNVRWLVIEAPAETGMSYDISACCPAIPEETGQLMIVAYRNGSIDQRFYGSVITKNGHQYRYVIGSSFVVGATIDSYDPIYVTDSNHPNYGLLREDLLYLLSSSDATPAGEDTDPYNPTGGSSEPGGGNPDSPQPSEDITDPSLPTISAVDTGFITLFKPSVSNLNSLATYMWSGGFDIDTFKKIMGNPMDAILGLSILPGIVPSGGSGTVVVGNISTGVSMPKVGNQYVKFNCGSKTIKRKWNAFLDYSPYTRAYIYLPYIGIHPLEVDDIMNKSVTVKYNIDVLSGGCTAFVIAGGTTLYAFTGQCACSVPVTGRDWTTLINGVLGAVTGTVGAIGSAMVGNLPGAIAGAASVAQNVLSSKPTIERSGSMGGMAGMMGIRTPYIIIERPVQAVPGKQNKYIGYPSFVTKKLGDVSGYTQAEVTHLEAIPATLAEQEEIKTILEEGVIL